MLMLPPDDFANEVGRLLRPDERCGMVVPRRDVPPDVSDKRLHRVEGSATHRLAGGDVPIAVEIEAAAPSLLVIHEW
jgi:hypothetical protein